MKHKAMTEKAIYDPEIRRKTIHACFVLSVVILLMNSVQAQVWGPPPVKLLDRTTVGKHICFKLSDGSDCGTETWAITVQSDGTRSIRAYTDWSATETQINVFLRADKNYRPLEAFANVYLGGRLSGTGLYVVDGKTLTVTVNAPNDYFVERLPLPGDFSLLLHPISIDGWHFGYYDKQGQDTQPGAIFTLGAARRSVLVKNIAMPLTFYGTETITVPAGTFETEHYRFGTPPISAEVWIHGPDRVVIKHDYARNDTRFLLTELVETLR